MSERLFARPTLDAALAFKDSMVPRRDGDFYRQPVWHEWAIVEAFLAGAKFERAQPPGEAAALETVGEAFAIMDRS